MGIKAVQDVTHIRQAYVRASKQRRRRQAANRIETEDQRTHTGGRREGRCLSGPVLRKARVSARDRATEGTSAPEVLEDSRTAGENIGCSGGPDMVRERDGGRREMRVTQHR
jgi:hypothetical protein